MDDRTERKHVGITDRSPSSVYHTLGYCLAPDRLVVPADDPVLEGRRHCHVCPE